MAKLKTVEAARALEPVFLALGVGEPDSVKSVTIDVSVKEAPTVTVTRYFTVEMEEALGTLWDGRQKP